MILAHLKRNERPGALATLSPSTSGSQLHRHPTPDAPALGPPDGSVAGRRQAHAAPQPSHLRAALGPPRPRPSEGLPRPDGLREQRRPASPTQRPSAGTRVPLPPAATRPRTALGKRPSLLKGWSRQTELSGIGGEGGGCRPGEGEEDPRTHRTSEPTYSAAASMTDPAAGQRRPRRLSVAGRAPPPRGGAAPPRPPPAPSPAAGGPRVAERAAGAARPEPLLRAALGLKPAGGAEGGVGGGAALPGARFFAGRFLPYDLPGTGARRISLSVHPSYVLRIS